MTGILSNEIKQVNEQKRVEKALEIALDALQKNANEDFRGARTVESVRSFKALKEIEAILKGEQT